MNGLIRISVQNYTQMIINKFIGLFFLRIFRTDSLLALSSSFHEELNLTTILQFPLAKARRKEGKVFVQSASMKGLVTFIRNKKYFHLKY